MNKDTGKIKHIIEHIENIQVAQKRFGNELKLMPVFHGEISSGFEMLSFTDTASWIRKRFG